MCPVPEVGERPQGLRGGHHEHVDAAALHGSAPRVSDAPRPRLALLTHQDSVHTRRRAYNRHTHDGRCKEGTPTEQVHEVVDIRCKEHNWNGPF